MNSPFLPLGRCIMIIILGRVRSYICFFNALSDSQSVRANKGRIPTPSNHASRPSFDRIADVIKATLVEAPQSHTEAKKNVRLDLSFHESSLTDTCQALIRDGYRCIVTGKYDARSVREIQELNDLILSDPSLRREPTQCAHIFAESTNSSIEPGSAKVWPLFTFPSWLLITGIHLQRNYAAGMWTVMSRFGHEELPDELNGPNVHRLENVMTLVLPLHVDFDQLMVWFVATVRLT